MANFIELPGGKLKRSQGRVGGEHPGNNDDRKIRKDFFGNRTGKRTGQRLRDTLASAKAGDEAALDRVLELPSRQSRSKQHEENRRC